jgi:glycosyltransferase involved in cell wall biosynthesis
VGPERPVNESAQLRVSLLTGGDDPHYAIPLAVALAKSGVAVDFVGNDDMQATDELRQPMIRYRNLRGNQDPRAAAWTKLLRIARYYFALIAYARRTDCPLFHLLWLNKFEVFDRTCLNAYYRLTGKKLLFTAHNVNAGKRDGRDTWLNRVSLRVMYALCHHIFVHTEPSRDELMRDFRVAREKITVIPYGLNTHVPETPLSMIDVRSRLGLGEKDNVLLFFGQIAPYKGLDILIEAMPRVAAAIPDARLIIAGKSKRGFESHWDHVRRRITDLGLDARVVIMDHFIPDEQVAELFRAADALVLPYRDIYQSGPLSLANRFGVPVIATRVGSFASDVTADTGVLCRPEDPVDLAAAIRSFFDGALHRDGDRTRKRIREMAQERYAWHLVSRRIVDVYARL